MNEIKYEKSFYDDGENKFEISTYEIEKDIYISKTHSFNVGIAQLVGVEEAIIIQNISFWIEHNAANNTNYHDGYYWTYNSVEAFTKLFPYWSKSKIRRILDKLEEKNIIKSGNYNNNTYNRTKWYTIIDKCICQIQQMEMTNSANGNDEIDKSTITYNKPDKKQYMKEYAAKVHLTEVEYRKLIDTYGKDNVDGKIEDMSEYIINRRNGKKYTSCYLALNKWLKKDSETKKEKSKVNVEFLR